MLFVWLSKSDFGFLLDVWIREKDNPAFLPTGIAEKSVWPTPPQGKREKVGKTGWRVGQIQMEAKGERLAQVTPSRKCGTSASRQLGDQSKRGLAGLRGCKFCYKVNISTYIHPYMRTYVRTYRRRHIMYVCIYVCTYACMHVCM